MRINKGRTSKEENEILTRVGRGTAMGELWRRYWIPVGISGDLKNKPTFIRVLGEDLVLFRDAQGRAGVLSAYCAHRRANLCLGDVERDGLRCRYHGWLYDIKGNVLQTPGEPAESKLKESVHQLAYPVEELGGLIFAYLGPKPPPLLARFDFLAGDGERYAKITGIADCNWLQCVENGIDPLHVSFTHRDVWTDLEVEPEMAFEETEYGLVHKAYRPGPETNLLNYREHHLLMPGISCGGSQQRNLEGAGGTPPTSCRWSMPIDDTHTLIIRLVYKPADNPGKFTRDPIPRGWKAVPIGAYKEYTGNTEDRSVVLGYTMPSVIATEDATLMDSLGPIVDRENETVLPTVDYGIMELRKMYLNEVEAVRNGRDPKGTFRDEAGNRLIVITAHERLISKDEVEQPRASVEGYGVQLRSPTSTEQGQK